MRVGIDATPLARCPSGVARVTQALADGLREAGHDVRGLVSGWHSRRDLGLRVHANRVPRPLNPLFFDLLRWPRVETFLGDIDVFVATNYVLPPTRRAASVAFVHDVGRLVRPELFGRRQVTRFRFQARRIGRNADLIVVPSRSVAADVTALGLAPSDRVHVLPLGVDAHEPDAATDLPDRPFVLSVATLERRKNVAALVRAFRTAAAELPHHLVLVGSAGPAAGDVLREARGTDRIHLLGHVAPQKLAALYRRADITVCPSLYEGFGLPLLEAMANGCAVLASDIAAHREVGGGAVRLVPADDDRALSRALVELGTDDTARDELRRKGLARSRRFSWDETRRRFADLLSERFGP